MNIRYAGISQLQLVSEHAHSNTILIFHFVNHYNCIYRGLEQRDRKIFNKVARRRTLNTVSEKRLAMVTKLI